MVTKLFNYEPRFMAQLSELIDLEIDDSSIAGDIQAVAFYELEGNSRYRRKTSEVAGAVGVSGSHGILMRFIQTLAKELKKEQLRCTDEINSLALSMMPTLIHWEPTSWDILQEAGLPVALYNVIDGGIKHTLDVYSAFPSALGALYLNEVGLALRVKCPQGLGLIQLELQLSILDLGLTPLQPRFQLHWLQRFTMANRWPSVKMLIDIIKTEGKTSLEKRSDGYVSTAGAANTFLVRMAWVVSADVRNLTGAVHILIYPPICGGRPSTQNILLELLVKNTGITSFKSKRRLRRTGYVASDDIDQYNNALDRIFYDDDTPTSVYLSNRRDGLGVDNKLDDFIKEEEFPEESPVNPTSEHAKSKEKLSSLSQGESGRQRQELARSPGKRSFRVLEMEFLQKDLQGFSPLMKGHFLIAVKDVLDLFLRRYFEVPFVFMHRQDYITYHEPRRSDAPEKSIQFFTSDELWRTHAIALRYIALIEQKMGLKRLFDKLGVEDLYFDECFQQIQFVGEVSDLMQGLTLEDRHRIQESQANVCEDADALAAGYEREDARKAWDKESARNQTSLSAKSTYEKLTGTMNDRVGTVNSSLTALLSSIDPSTSTSSAECDLLMDEASIADPCSQIMGGSGTCRRVKGDDAQMTPNGPKALRKLSPRLGPNPPYLKISGHRL
ncbi:hypothetical protein PPACK8108_LOCUS23406 [Phakopsora pachyrhizi]|uniref:Uncharacterized protein n=1 Tax=Phakopsora pachyrhizi TaxID=170000 RepID=A0AAV0BMA2_PHAPC|nr:hypothetical protein PPACK8108_LOCUS23406 [Phakopsora pachyrhizi]